MTNHYKMHAKRTAHSPPGNTQTETPLHLVALDAPRSTTSLTGSPSRLIPVLAAFDNFPLDSPHNNTRLPSIPALHDTSSKITFPSSASEHSPMAQHPRFSAPFFAGLSPTPVVDIHSKIRDETTHRCNKKLKIGLEYTSQASRRLHLLVGVLDPQPFVCPPEMPADLGAKFAEGLKEFGADTRIRKTKKDTPREASKKQPVSARFVGNSRLGYVREELGGPDTGTHGRAADLRIQPPMWKSDREAIGGRGETNGEEHDDYYAHYEDASETDVEDIGYKNDHATSGFGSCTTQVDGHVLCVESSLIRPMYPPRTDSLPRGLHNIGQNDAIDTTCLSAETADTSYLPAQVHPCDTPIAATTALYHESLRHITGSAEAQRSDHFPLFPSPRVEASSSSVLPDFPQHIAFEAQKTPNPSNPILESGTPSPSMPHITIQGPSPQQKCSSKKRAPSLDQLDLLGSLSTRFRAQKATGLPVLPASAEALWKYDFPGNTYALLSILLTWAHAMQSFHNQLPQPCMFRHNSAFPYLVKLPVHRRLLAIAFYDTSTQPHREVRFLGPNDAAELVYGEVDTFKSEESDALFKSHPEIDLTIGTAKSRPELKHPVAHIAMSHRASTGEGRWAYVLIKGHQDADSKAPPHMLIAWHTSSITDESTGLHTIVPAEHIGAASKRSSQAPGRSSYIPNLGTGKGNVLLVHQALRSASSTHLRETNSEEHAPAPDEGALILRRTTMNLGQAGCIPLIEGYRVDVSIFKPWLEAVGGGNGKLIMWKTKE